jgi:arylsulfatase A-like enzyme
MAEGWARIRAAVDAPRGRESSMGRAGHAEPHAVPRAGLSSIRWIVATSIWFGLVAGFAEGAIDLTVAHLHAPAILCVTLLADVALFLVLGLGFWLISRVFARSPSPAVVFFTFTFVFLRCLQPLPDFSIPTLAVDAFAATLLSIGFQTHLRGFTRLVRRSLPWLVGTAVLCELAIPAYGVWSERQAMHALPAIAQDSPNVVLVILDTVRADHLTCYGYGRPTSPNLDRLGRQGVLFETAIAPSSWTLPSHASMLTGTYPHAHHVDLPAKQLASGFPILPRTLRRAGYRTAAFSGNTFYFTRATGLGQGFIHFGDFFLSTSDALAQVNFVWDLDKLLISTKLAENYLGRQSAARMNRAALRWIDGSRRPFFLVLNYMDAHDPYVPPEPWRHRFSERPNPSGRLNFPTMTPGQLRDAVEAYDGAIAYEDDQLGRLVGELDRRGLLSNTLLIVTSDHGEAFGGHELLGHANSLYFPLVHVPLLFHWPGHVPAGVRVARPVSTKDIAATVLALAGQPPHRLPGESLEALWNPRGEVDGWPLPISELAPVLLVSKSPRPRGPIGTIIAPEAQYIAGPRLGPQLYDWKADPREVRNLVHDPRYEGLARELGDALKAEEQPQGPGAVAVTGHP